MANISEQKKVKLLEASVLKNDIDEVNELFKKYGKFEFTARAVGLAMRFSGLEMVKALLDNGASLKYEMTTLLKQKYKCNIHINTYRQDDVAVDYSWYLFPNYKLKEYDNAVIGDDERVEILKLLYDRKEGDFQEILYNAIFFDDQRIYDALKKLGVNKISEYRTDIVSGRVPINRLEAAGRDARRKVLLGSGEMLVRRLKRFLECMDEKKIGVFKSELYSTDLNSPRFSGKLFEKKFCSEETFDFFLHHTNMLAKVKKLDIVFALVDKNNARGIKYALSENWISKPKDIDLLLSYAQERSKIKPELIGYILEKQNETASVKTKKKAIDTELSLDKKPLSAGEMKKIWGYKKESDSTIIITSYKGYETDIVIPSAIGKSKVTAIDPNTFSTSAPRVTEIQKKVRKAIVSVEFPGTIETIPSNMFCEDRYPSDVSGIAHANLKRVVINKGTKFISEEAFRYCTGLEEIIIPESVSNIGDRAFGNCYALKSIKLPKTIKRLSNYMFSGCGFESFEIPEQITDFGDEVFGGCCALKSIKLPKTIKRLSNYMFNDCGFESFEIPEQITDFGHGVFCGCKNLKTVKMPDNISEIADSMFSHCTSLETFEFQKSIVKIGDSAFKECSDLKSIHVPAGTKLGNEVFFNCNRLANEDGQIIVNDILFGVKDTKDGWKLSAKDVVEPLEIKSEIKKIAVDRSHMPEIVYREHSEEGAAINVADLSVGDEICFGRFPDTKEYVMRPLRWRVIAKENGKALLITVQSIICGKVEERDKKIVWAKCFVRKLLNKGFLNTAFTEIEREQILVSKLDNPGNKDLHIDEGPATKDRVFLLSLYELARYMPTGEDRGAVITEYAYNAYGNCWNKHSQEYWQLRTSDRCGLMAVCMGRWNGSVASLRNIDYYLRPAIWIQ